MKELRFNAADGVWRVAFALIAAAVPSFLLPETSQAEVKSGFTKN